MGSPLRSIGRPGCPGWRHLGPNAGPMCSILMPRSVKFSHFGALSAQLGALSAQIGALSALLVCPASLEGKAFTQSVDSLAAARRIGGG